MLLLNIAGTYLGNGGVEAWDLEVRVGWGWTITLHGDQPWWRELLLTLGRGGGGGGEGEEGKDSRHKWGVVGRQ